MGRGDVRSFLYDPLCDLENGACVGDEALALVGVLDLMGDKSQMFRLLPMGDELVGVVVKAGGVAGGEVFIIDEEIVFIELLVIVSTE